MAARKRKPRKAGRRKKKEQLANWIWLLIGLSMGLAVAVGIYISDRQNETALPVAPSAAETEQQTATERAKPDDNAASANRFTFYELLPKFEVVIPEEDLNVVPDNRNEPVARPGVYVLQAGSFSNFPEADRMKAQLALLGILSNIQKVTVDDRTYHRVRIGPIDRLEQLNMLRKQLRDAHIEILVIQVGE